ncbi:GH23421 [Drosophila grimshawi]|uniref:GH23421 n=1 Tax=Drosophila grimshawi TaxID=7222 RepID=B4K157_DROGR|nr:GH23421 [Drosophila grimshawi]
MSWLPKSAMRPVGTDASHTDCILVVGVSRPKLAVVFLTVMLISLFLTFHVLYDSAVYNIQAAQAVHERHRLSLAASASASSSFSSSSSSSSSSAAAAAAASSFAGGTLNANHLPVFVKPVASSNQLSHPMVFPSSRVHFPKTSRRLPQALIIGVRKCGTRALLEMLYLHPRIQKAGGEVHFFDRDENYLKGLDWYRKKMPHSFRGQITIEKSPSYFVSPEVPERVRAMNASIKLLLIVREPVTRAISDYTQLRSHAATAILPLAESSAPGSGYGAKLPTPKSLYAKLHAAHEYDNALGSGAGAKETLTGSRALGAAARRAAIGTTTPTPTPSAAQLAAKSFEELAIFPNGTVNEAYRPLSISMYHMHLHRWLEVFPREQLLVVNGDRLIEDPLSQLKRIEAFLGIEHRVRSEHFYFNETKGFYCLRYDNGDRCLRETKGRKHPHVDPVVVSRLRKFFAEYNQRFYELVGEDLGWPEE